MAHSRCVLLGPGRRAGEQAMGRQQLLDLAGHLDAAVRDDDEEVGNPLELGEDVRRQHDRDAVLGDGPHHHRHEIVPGDRIEGGHRLVEDEELRPSGECQRQRELRLLAARQRPCLALQRNCELVEPLVRVALVEATVQVARLVDEIGSREVPVERRVLGNEGDAIECGERTGAMSTEHRDLAGRRECKPDREVQEGRLAGPVWTDERDHVPIRNGQVAVVECARLPVGLSEAARLDDVHGRRLASSRSRFVFVV